MKRSFFSSTYEKESEESLVNLTPLIDVVFVVLITFILIAPLLQLDRIHLAPGRQSEKKEFTPIEKDASIKISVFEDNSIWINHHLVSEKELYPYLQKLQKAIPSATPQLFHDKNASFGTYQTIKNAVEASGFAQMDVVLNP